MRRVVLLAVVFVACSSSHGKTQRGSDAGGSGGGGAGGARDSGGAGAGTSGSGVAGAIVDAGTAGTTGPAGMMGTAGTTGQAGMMGAAGTAGAAGMMGTAGTTGAAGAAGTTPQADCTNLQCRQSTCASGACAVPACPNGGRTTVSGKVYDPAGKTPLFNITVYVPNGELAAIKDGPSCDPCDPKTGASLLSGDPVVVTKTDESGTFHLGLTGPGDVPAGGAVPLVIQDGKWRRQITVPTVTACADTPLTDVDQTRLPRSQAEGHIPRIALTTGETDALECLLRKIGIADSEFTPESGAGRVNLYQGGHGAASYDATLNGGAAFTSASPWWDSYDNLAKYDVILHACDGTQGAYTPAKGIEPMFAKSMDARVALQKFADLGGRVFASHYHAYWFEEGTASFRSIATFEHDPGLPNPYDATIDQTLDGGRSLAKWMIDPFVQGSTTLGLVTLEQDAAVRMIAAPAGGDISQSWLYAPMLTPPSVLFLSATTPIPGGACGRVVLSDLHVSSGSNGSDLPRMPFPTGCVTSNLSPREKILEYMMFDIASCVRATH